jgi:hypothetical protein
MMKRQFPFIEVPAEARRIVGEPTPGTRLYRREGSHEECGQWFEDIGKLFGGDVGFSPGGVTVYVPVSRAAVHKRLKEGRLTGFTFYVTSKETTFLGKTRKAKHRPYLVLSVSECKAWAEEMKRRLGYEDEPETDSEAQAAEEFVEMDPKDKGNKKVVYKEPMSRQEIIALVKATARGVVEETIEKLMPGKRRK